MANYVDTSRDQLLERPLPHSAESERAILGAIILDNGLVNQAIELLKPEDFYTRAHYFIFRSMILMSERGAEINPILLGEELRRDGSLEQVGGVAFISELTYGLPHFTNITHYAKVVKDKSLLRQLVKVCNKVTSEALEEEDEANIILDHAEQLIFALADERTRQGFAHVKPVADQLLEKVQEMSGRSVMLTGLTTGFTELDTITSGLQSSDLVIVAARPSMGKTSFCLTLAQNAAIQAGAVVGVFSLEMSKESLVMRMLSSEGRVDAHRFRSGFLSRDEWARLAGALGSLSETKIFIDDTPGISVLEMRAKARRLAAEQKRLDLLVVDYLQLMSGSSRRSESRQQEVSQISRELKGLAKELNVPLVALSQLSRAPEARTDHRPQLADLRECIVGNSMLADPETGQRRTIAELYTHGKEFPVWTLNNELKIVKSAPARVIKSGEKDVFRLRTMSGREVRASASHPLLTLGGWRSLETLVPGEQIAVPCRYPWAGHGKTKTLHDRLSLSVKTPIHELKMGPEASWLPNRDRSPGQRRSVAHWRRVAVALGAAHLLRMANSDIYWDRIVEITPAGREMTYDLVVPETHNFVADDIIVHNSGAIEQDADVVAFIYREEQYNRTEENAGIAELIIAKQRNGPTGIVKLAFLKEFTRFENMWRE